MGGAKAAQTIEGLRNFAKTKGWQFLEDSYVNSVSLLKWKCAQGHIFEVSWSRLSRCKWSKYHPCDFCYKELKLNEARTYAISKNGTCSSSEYVNDRKIRLSWKCSNIEHPSWDSTFHDTVKGKKWCPYCSGNKAIYDGFEKVKELCKTHNFVLLSKKFKSRKSPILVEGPCGDIWNTNLERLLKGTSCGKCLGTAKLSILDMQKTASDKGGICLSNDYINSSLKLEWVCKKNHKFWMTPNNVRSQKQWCPKCANVGSSKGQKELEMYIKSFGYDIEINTRKYITNPKTNKGLELDIYIPQLKTGFEYNGLMRHSSYSKSAPGRHLIKFYECKKVNISLFTIFEDEWKNKQDLVKAMIRWRLKKFCGIKLRASKLIIKKLNKNSSYKDFFQQNHLDGHVKSKYAYGLFLEDKLISCLSIRRNRENKLEISRYATDYNYSVAGAASRLIKRVLKDLNKGDELISFSSNRLSDGGVYKKNGFIEITKSENKPDYWYTDLRIRVNRQRCIRNKDPDILLKYPTEKEQALNGIFSQKLFGDNRPLYRVEGCGNKKWSIVKISD